MRPIRSFISKFIAVTGVGILIGLAANVWVASSNLDTLANESTNEIERGLGAVNKEYLSNYIADATARLYLLFEQAMAETKTLADITQEIIDSSDDLQPLFRLLPSLKPLSSEMIREPGGAWVQNTPDSATVVTVLGSSLNPDGSIPERIKFHKQQTALLDLVMPAVMSNGSDKLQLYYLSPDEDFLVRVAPHKDLGPYLQKSVAPNTLMEIKFWSYFFGGLVDAWKAWLTEEPERLKEYESPSLKTEMRQLTVTPPYVDAAGGGMVVTLFHPLWSTDRKHFEGAIGVDLLIDRIIKDIEALALGQTGFAFLAQSNGNILAINQSGLNTLGLTDTGAGSSKDAGLAMQEQYFKNSSEPAVAALQLPLDEKVHFSELSIAGHRYVLVMKRMGEFSAWHPGGAPYIRPEAWTLGFLMPMEEIYSSLIASRKTIAHTTSAIRMNQVLIMLITLILVLAGVYWVSQRMTVDLVALSQAASRIMRKDYHVRVAINTQDEVGHLGAAFNEMAREIRVYTQDLETLVEQRTSELKQANEEIHGLNDRLKEENVRLAAEIDVARRIQSMVLPHASELQSIRELDIDGYMSPADEVGGDYYDVLQGPNAIKLGMGDVTGHGLESGVMMLMVQTAVRTLLIAGERDPVRFINLINQVVFANKQRMDVERTLSLSLLDYSDGVVTVTGQHEELLIVRVDGTLERLDTADLGFPVGLDPDVAHLFASTQVSIATGDTVVLYTDGITEAENPQGEYYGVERLCDIIVGKHGASAREIREAIVTDVLQFIGTQEVYDDITVLVIKKT